MKQNFGLVDFFKEKCTCFIYPAKEIHAKPLRKYKATKGFKVKTLAAKNRC